MIGLFCIVASVFFFVYSTIILGNFTGVLFKLEIKKPCSFILQGFNDFNQS